MTKNALTLPRLAVTAAAGVLAFALSSPAAHAQVSFGVHIGGPPPPLRYENRPPPPGPGFVWIDGYNEPHEGAYRWHGGYWARRPTPMPTMFIRTGITTPMAGICTRDTGLTAITTITTIIIGTIIPIEL